MDLRERMIMLIEATARQRVEELSSELARASSQEKEDILAGLEFERWLADCCRDSVRPG